MIRQMIHQVMNQVICDLIHDSGLGLEHERENLAPGQIPESLGAGGGVGRSPGGRTVEARIGTWDAWIRENEILPTMRKESPGPEPGLSSPWARCTPYGRKKWLFQNLSQPVEIILDQNNSTRILAGFMAGMEHDLKHHSSCPRHPRTLSK